MKQRWKTLQKILLTMCCTFFETQKLSVIKGKQTLYNYKKKGYLDNFIETIEVKK